MDQPARLPATEAELDAWAVYADSLIARGDPRGDLIALDLALPAAPSDERLADYKRLALRCCKLGTKTPIAWSLGHARTLAVPLHYPFKNGRAVYADTGMLARARDLVRSPLGARLEQLDIGYPPDQHAAHWRALFDALPPTCTRVEVELGREAAELDVRALADQLPAHVRTLALRGRWRERMLGAITDRFDVVELTAESFAPAVMLLLPAILAASQRVTVQLPSADASLLGLPRCRLGGPDEAALFGTTPRWATSLPRASLLALQELRGHVPLRAQWARALPERHGFLRGGFGLVASPYGSTLLRRGARWTLGTSGGAVALGGVALADREVREVGDGAWLTIDGIDATLLLHDADVRCRERFAQRAL